MNPASGRCGVFSLWCDERPRQATQHALEESQFWAFIERQVRDPKLSSGVLDLNGSEGWKGAVLVQFASLRSQPPLGEINQATDGREFTTASYFVDPSAPTLYAVGHVQLKKRAGLKSASSRRCLPRTTSSATAAPRERRQRHAAMGEFANGQLLYFPKSHTPIHAR
jgi:hypothetical protein